MPDELARLAAWWNDAFVAYKRIVLLAGDCTMPRDTVDQFAQVLRWEWLDDPAREAAAAGMRALMLIAHDWSDTRG